MTEKKIPTKAEFEETVRKTVDKKLTELKDKKLKESDGKDSSSETS
jgi:hypothetical protein